MLEGKGGDHVGDCYLYQLTLHGSLLEPDIKEYENLRVVNLLQDGVSYHSVYGAIRFSFLEGYTGNDDKPGTRKQWILMSPMRSVSPSFSRRFLLLIVTCGSLYR